MSNYMLPAPLTDATLTQEGCPADAKAVGVAETNIRNDIANKIDIAKSIGYSYQEETYKCDLARLQNGSYLLIAPRSSFVSAFEKKNETIICFDTNIEVAGTKITIKNLKQWHTTVFAIKIK